MARGILTALTASLALLSTQASAARPARSLRTENTPEHSHPASTVVIASSSASLGAGQCLGVVVAPLSVLASTECLEHELHVFSQQVSTLSVRSTRDDRSEVGVLGLAHGPSVHKGGSFSLLMIKRSLLDVTPALLHVASTSEHTSGNQLHVSGLQKDQSASWTPTSLLEPSACAPQFTQLRKSAEWDAADWLCIDSGLAAISSSCEANTTEKTSMWVSDGFLFGQDSQTGGDVLYGLVWSSETQCDAESVGTPTTTPVNGVRAMRKLLAKHQFTWRWTTPVAAPPVPRSTGLTQPIPANTSSPSGSAGDETGDPNDLDRDSHNGRTREDDDASPSPPSLPRAPVPHWLQQLYYTAALLTPTNDTQRLDDSTSLAIFLTPRHLVVPRLWLRGKNVSTIQWATTTEGDQFRVTKITTEAEFYRDTPAVLAAADDLQLDLLVVEIDVPTRQPATEGGSEDTIQNETTEPPDDNEADIATGNEDTQANDDTVDDLARRTPIVALPPKLNVAYERTVIAFADRALKFEQTRPSEPLPSREGSGSASGLSEEEAGEQGEVDFIDGVFRFQSLDRCVADAKSSTPDESLEFMCSNSTMNVHGDPLLWETVTAAAMTSTVGILKEDNQLVGFTLPSQLTPYAYTVMRLGAPVHRAFLDAATAGTVEWTAQDAFSDDAETVAAYQPYVARLHKIDDLGTITDTCSGLLIAPQFVLTMASCLRSVGSFTSVALTKQWEKERQYAVRSDLQIPHPLYETAEDYAVDVAVIGLVDPVLDIEPVALNPGYPAWVVNASVVDGSHGLPSRGIVAGGDRQPEAPSTLVDCGPREHPYGRPKFFRTRGMCVKPSSRPNFERGRLRPVEGKLLLTKTAFGALTASGFSVRTTDNDEPSDPGLMAATISSEPEVQVYLSFADNANFINGHATGVVWGSRSATLPQASLPSAPPYVVGLRITRDGPNFCSGTLVASGYVLTAAHCVSDALANFVVVSGGESGPEVLPVVLETVQIHPSFGSPYKYSNDAAVLELATPASTYGVALDLSFDYAAKTRATMFGFGVRSRDDLDKPATVRTIDGMPLYTRAQCAATLPDIDGSMLCAGGEKGKDACQGDSGGPLVVKSAQGRDALAGIVSAGYGCGLEGVPGVYARVSSLVGFVDSYVVGCNTMTVTGSLKPSMASSTPSPSTEARSGVDPADIESYSGNGSSPSHSGNHSNNTVVQAPGFAQSLASTPVPADLPEPVRVALMSFLLGDWYSFVEDPASGLNPLVDPDNQLTLRSRGDAGAILSSLRRHEAKPLNSRKDRFQRGVSVKHLWESAADASSANACTA